LAHAAYHPSAATQPYLPDFAAAIWFYLILQLLGGLERKQSELRGEAAAELSAQPV